MQDAEPNLADTINAVTGGWNRAMGLVFRVATADEVVAELEVSGVHKQPYGIVHGGVHAGVIEACCSTGAAIFAGRHGRSAVGLENSTAFLRAVRGGKLTATAVPLQRGRRAQVWECTVRDEQGRAVSSGRVRLICLEGGEALAGKEIEVEG
ncbi:MAG: PaaI family thioesterase [Polyangiaceae bacterium]|nr:PaaI family thioesterase [Polyangiaceae bacterium]